MGKTCRVRKRLIFFLNDCFGFSKSHLKRVTALNRTFSTHQNSDLMNSNHSVAFKLVSLEKKGLTYLFDVLKNERQI